MSNGFDDLLGSDDLFADDGSDMAHIFKLPSDSADDRAIQHPAFSAAAGDVPAGEFGRVSYDRGDNEIVGKPTALDGDYVPRARTSNQAERVAARAAAERARADTGNRNVGRAAGHDTGGHQPGGARATDLATAADALRATVRPDAPQRPPDVPGKRSETSAGELDHRVAAFINGRLKGQAPHRAAGTRFHAPTQKTVTRAPDFRRTEFNCEIYGIKQNNAGSWLVTVKLENSESDRIPELARASGLNLRTVMESIGFAH